MRRRRFKAVLRRDGSRWEKVILCQTTEQAYNYYGRLGYEVLAVRPVPRGGEARKPLNQWYLDRAAWDAALAQIGLKMPVQLKESGHQGGRRGAYKLSPNGLVHCITVKSWLSAERASRTIWHELCHALQTEQMMAQRNITARQAHKLRIANERGVSYLAKSYETEARSFETNADALPLAKPRNFARTR